MVDGGVELRDVVCSDCWDIARREVEFSEVFIDGRGIYDSV